MTLRPLILLAALAACTEPAPDEGRLGRGDGAGTAGPGSSLELGLVFDGQAPKDVLMISWDTTRPDYLGWYSGLDTTPELDALFAGSVVLEDHRSCSNWTYASMVCFQTGMRDVEAGYIPSIQHINEAAPDDLLLASERLSNQGFQTALISANNFLGPNYNTADGFDTVDADQTAGAEWITDRALSRLEAFEPDRPFYLHAHYIDPHAPYGPPPIYLGELDDLPGIPYDLGTQDGYTEMVQNYDRLDSATQELILQHLDVRYRGELQYADEQLGLLLDEVEAMGLLEDTLVVFWTDHGEQFYEHGESGHANSLYDVENSSTVSFWARGIRPGPWRAPTSHPDVWPTILDALGIPSPGSTGHVLGTRPSDTVRYGFQHAGGGSIQMVEREGQKLLFWWQDGEVALHDVAADPEEQVDLWDPDSPLAQQLWPLLEAEVEQIIAVRGDDNPL